jgi:uncharacterized protein YcgI (DUF1989 family)
LPKKKEIVDISILGDIVVDFMMWNFKIGDTLTEGEITASKVFQVLTFQTQCRPRKKQLDKRTPVDG